MKGGAAGRMSIKVDKEGYVTWRADIIGKALRITSRTWEFFPAESAAATGAVHAFTAKRRHNLIHKLEQMMLAYERTEGGK